MSLCVYFYQLRIDNIELGYRFIKHKLYCNVFFPLLDNICSYVVGFVNELFQLIFKENVSLVRM